MQRFELILFDITSTDWAEEAKSLSQLLEDYANITLHTLVSFERDVDWNHNVFYRTIWTWKES